MAQSKINNILVTGEEDSPGSCRRIGNTITGSIPNYVKEFCLMKQVNVAFNLGGGIP